MAGLPRPTPVARMKSSSMRPPPRPSSRAQSVASSSARSGTFSPTDTRTGTKRKERDFESERDQDEEETNINVVVRCRGRNEREVRENSGVVLSTEGVKGSSLQLSMGPSALSNKTYHFDKVFSSAADQGMIYDDVVTPLLDEMLSGYNCTIFAYGQTGTGKTYTMSGDMNDTLGMLSDAAGIIPRALHALFNKLDDAESSVKCSFIELYNEELRDLISPDDGAKLKIYDDNNKKGHPTTMVQGMEESHIKSAAEGVTLLQQGSLKRQVAATKCNDLSSRSHTVFTVTAYIKRTAENGEEYVSAGKLNLVDLAGSENIQRSGAENKRAAEAGLINRSLLTLGRVINALVDRSAHIPYRESKLTRLLQDSLGGRTKTCIIATVSPAKSNLEETISTLDYAFRAKNIRNKPQVNQMINKKTLLKEFTFEIERLKSELIATRQRNGVYISNENYEEMITESESRKILSEEQAAKIETMESNLRNKVQELYSLTSNFMTLKKDNEGTKAVLDETKSVLEQTEFVLAKTHQNLAEETLLRRAHQDTEEKLSMAGTELLSTLGRTVEDVSGLHAKNKRKSDLHLLNRNTWSQSQDSVTSVTNLVSDRISALRTQQEVLMTDVSSRMQSFIEQELHALTTTQDLLQSQITSFTATETEVSTQTLAAKDEMDLVLEEIKTLREAVKAGVATGLQGLSVAAERISGEVVSELGAFHTQLHTSYSSLGRDFKTLFEDLLRHVDAQKAEADALRQQLHTATAQALESSAAASVRLEEVLREERVQAATDREKLVAQIADVIRVHGDVQEQRLEGKVGAVREEITSSREVLEKEWRRYEVGMDAWSENEGKLGEEVLRSRETLKSKLKDDWMAANNHTSTLQASAASVHAETVRIVDLQMSAISTQMQSLDSFVTRARLQNSQHHSQHATSLATLSSTMTSSHLDLTSHTTSRHELVRRAADDMAAQTHALRATLDPLDDAIRHPLAELRAHVESLALQEYRPTGETPRKMQYLYPAALPRTESHETLLAKARGATTGPARVGTSPTKSASSLVFTDAVDRDIDPGHDDAHTRPGSSGSGSGSGSGTASKTAATAAATSHSLREIDLNIPTRSLLSSCFTDGQGQQQQQQGIHPCVAGYTGGGGGGGSNGDETTTTVDKQLQQQACFKRSVSASVSGDKPRLPVAKSGKKNGNGHGHGNGVVQVPMQMQAEGRENLTGPISVFSQSVGAGAGTGTGVGTGRRRSPRTG